MTSTAKIRWGAVAIAALAVLAGYVVYPNTRILNFGTKLGLDLKGGTRVIYEADTSEVSAAQKGDAVEGVRDVIERRVNAFGVAEPRIQTTGGPKGARVIVELAGVQDADKAIQIIGETPQLDFRELATDFRPDSQEEPPEALTWQITKLSGRHLKRSDVDFDPQTNTPLVKLTFNNEGKELFAQITERNLQKPVGIFLDGEPITTPVVQDKITQGQAVITGDFTLQEAKDLARSLNAGALPVPIELVSRSTVGPSLGKASLGSSLVAGLTGLILMMLYMILLYRLPGIIAALALALYALLNVAVYKLIGVTLTLAGIAGFILSVGMAVDANILIFERLKEELCNGRSLLISVHNAFRDAWESIRDSNVSTLITCALLYTLGSSIVKGFALTLGVGVLISMFSAISVSRTLLLASVYTPLASRLRAYVGGLGNGKSQTES